MSEIQLQFKIKYKYKLVFIQNIFRIFITELNKIK